MTTFQLFLRQTYISTVLVGTKLQRLRRGVRVVCICAAFFLGVGIRDLTLKRHRRIIATAAEEGLEVRLWHLQLSAMCWLLSSVVVWCMEVRGEVHKGSLGFEEAVVRGKMGILCVSIGEAPICF